LPALVELALPFLKLGGYLAAPKGSHVEGEITAAGKALEVCGGQVVFTTEMPIMQAEPSLLVLVRKISATPATYPRRAGMPVKRPLR
jgi:16S rRNA (guanine527-N7)-methyltransferase